LDELRLENCAEIGDDDLLLIDKLVNLKRLDIRRKLGDHVISNKFLSHVRSLKKLQELSIVGIARITDSGIAEVRGLESLRRLDVSQTGITLAGVIALKLPNLEDLSVGDYPDDSRLASSLPNLTALSIGLGKRKNQVAVQLPENLRRLSVTQTGSAPEFQSLPQHLEYVSVYNPNFGKDVDLDWLASLPELAELRILADGDKSITAAAKCKKLRSLTLAECSPPSEQGIEYLARISTLESLAIVSGARVTDRSLGSIGGLADLRSLELGSLNGVTLTGITALARLRGLRSLSIDLDKRSSLRPFDKVLERITSLTALEQLSLHNVRVTDEGMKALSALKKLRSLDLTESSGFTDDGLASLVVALPELRTINISYSPSR
jgi:Leucine-rich repeat (LRR) protein